MSGATRYTVYVAVHKGDPMDFSKYRHTGLWFVPENSVPHYFYHVRGKPTVFLFEMRKNWDPTRSANFAKKVLAGRISHPLTASELEQHMRSVTVGNDDHEFNCQQWVQMALLLLRQKGLLTQEQYDAGVDGMIDATMEAADEDIA
ncbi:hypothetical protein FPSE_02924 [Fusarium pseudograminearum CS3096]|uniref:Uncharacterized protein n=1 Tax=Fusarium pseudograminearum (strain CS3096) TaxID=1028729 RepID=K3UW98_FUSPC|nr:hypothetical protein FPSE_02924 [Fusarium pseudograminearum CS3096]EKJ76926.1 hypothetical protein FPSE_02924 [Fusarium pseudograminearum CS3096]